MRNAKIKRLITFRFKAKLLQKDGNELYSEFQVLAPTQTKAERLLEEYLSIPNLDGLKCKKCVGIRDKCKLFVPYDASE